MTKRLFYFAAGALALTACTSQDVVEDMDASRNRIQFENVVNKLTRADDLTGDNLAQFNVFGFYTMPENDKIANEVFEDVPVLRQDNGTWAYSGESRYWVENAKYYFYAYSCGNGSKLDTKYGKFNLDMQDNLSASDRVLTINDYVCDYTHQHDLIYASNTGATAEDPFAGILGLDKGNDPVGFQFKHLLSKVKARFTTKFPTEYTVSIKNVSIVNIRNVGTYRPGTGWQKVDRKEGDQPKVFLLDTSNANINPISVSNKKDSEGNQVYVDSHTAYVLPYGYEGVDGTEDSASTWVYLNFEIEVYKGTNKVTSKILTGKFNPSWLEGYSYIYNVEISGDSTGMQVITFTTATDKEGNVVTDWVNLTSPTITIDK